MIERLADPQLVSRAEHGVRLHRDDLSDIREVFQILEELIILRAGHTVIMSIQADRDCIQYYDGRALDIADLGTNLDHCVCGAAPVMIGGVLHFLIGNSWGTARADAYGSGWGVDAFTIPGMPLGPNYPAPGYLVVKASVIKASDTLIALDLYKLNPYTRVAA